MIKYLISVVWQATGCSAQWEAVISSFWVSGLGSEEAHGFISGFCQRFTSDKGDSAIFWLLKVPALYILGLFFLF